MSRARDAIKDYATLTAALSLNAPLVVLILLRNIDPSQFGPLSWAYFLAVCLGYYLFALCVVTSLSYLVLFPFRRLALGVSMAITTVAIYFLLVDSFVVEVVRMHIDLFWLEWVLNDFDAFGLSAATLRSALLAFVVLAAVEVGIFVVGQRLGRRRRITPALWSMLVLSFAVSQAAHALAYEKNDRRITGLTPQLPMFLPITSHSNAARFEGLLSLSDSEPPAESPEATTLYYPKQPLRFDPDGADRRTNVVILFLESWRHDMMNDSVTPRIAALARRATVCRNHFCSGNSTVAGVFGFFYGLHPTYWPAVKADNAAIHNPVLIDVLSERGYDFGIYARSNFERHKIKDAVFRDITVHEDFAGPGAVEQDADMTRQVISFVRGQRQKGRPFLTYAFYKANHAPYRYPPTDTIFRPAADQNLVGASKRTDPTAYLNDYRNATHYVDGLIGNVIDSLDALGLMDNTVVIISTDHGEEFNDNRNGYWGHGSDYTRYQTQVPLVFYAPGRGAREIESVTAHVDVVPTLLEEYFGCLNRPNDYSSGRSIYAADTAVRPLVIGSYVNHAFIIGDDVFEVNPLYVKDYKLGDITAPAGVPDPDELRLIASEVGAFRGAHTHANCQEP